MRQTGNFLSDSIRGLGLWRVWGYLAINDLRGRFARSMLGFAWILVSFAIWAAGVGLIYARLFNLDANSFVPFLTIGFALWGFISASFVESSGALINSSGYVKQFNLPKQTYIFRSLLSQIITLSMSLAVCFIILAIFRVLTFQGVIFALPGLLLLLFAAMLHAFLSAYITPYVRDFPHAISSLLNVLFFVTPIIFPAQMLEKKGLGTIFVYNPFYYLLEVVREPLLQGTMPGSNIWIGAGAYVTLLGIVVWALCRSLDKRLVYAL
jgi:ABC-type polysaccharide/polyol phosphate export permease